nr:sigma-70 family RNA polymerase sigma factor [Gammaproteobacteria bacterium]
MTAISTVMNASGKTLRPNERSANLRKNQLEKRKPLSDPATLNTSTGQINNSARRKLIKSNLAVDPVSGNGPELIDCKVNQAAANLNARLEQMESIRSEILTLLIGTHAGMVAMASQYLNNVDDGVSPTDLFSLSRSQLSFESDRDNPVNTSAKLVADRLADAFRLLQEHDLTQPDLSEIHQQIDLIASIHFLPILLIDVSKTLLHSQFGSIDNSTINPVFLKRLEELTNRMVALRSEIAVSNLGLIKYLAHQYHPQNMTQEDILQEGVVGLLRAVDRFDHRRRLRFSTYATYWIQQAITRSMSKNDKLVRIPINLSPKAPAVFRLVNSRFIETGHVPSAVEL